MAAIEGQEHHAAGTRIRPTTPNGATMAAPDINALLDDLLRDPELQRRWELDPAEVAKGYSLTESQMSALLSGDVDALTAEGLAERHVQQMRVSW